MKGKQRQLAVAVVFLAFCLLVFVFFAFYFSWGFLTMTGNVVLENNEGSVGDEDFNRPEGVDFNELSGDLVDDFSFENISSPTGGVSSGGGGGGGGGGSPFVGYGVGGLRENLSLYYSGQEVSDSDRFYGRVRFELRRFDLIISRFDIFVYNFVSLENISAEVSSENKSAFIYDPDGLLGDVDLYIPRGAEDVNVLVCENVASLENLSSCSGSIINSSSEKLSVSSDGDYFVVRNHSNIGGVSGGEELGYGVNLLSPFSRVVMKGQNVTFQFVVNHGSNLSYCDFYFDETLEETLVEPGVGELLEVVLNVSVGEHLWGVECVDENLTDLMEVTRTTTFFKASEYGGKTTDLSLVGDLSNVTNFTLENVYHGSIVFDKPVDLRNGLDFDEFVKIDRNYIEVDSSAIPELNVSAVLTFYDLDVENPVILRDGVVCDDCELIEFDGDIRFRVNHFSSYTVSENSRLEVFDSTDDSQRNPSDSVTFYANYTNVTDGTAITGGSVYCNVTFPDAFAVMSYNGASGTYEYSRTFSSAGTYLATVQCYGQPDGFTSLNVSDSYTITPEGLSNLGVNGANVSSLGSERAQSDSPGQDARDAGNITDVLISAYSVTQTWQGYVGNVSGVIQLADSGDNVLYNWSTVEPEGEVYATSSGLLSWKDIQCFNFTATGTYGDESGNGGGTNLNGTNLEILEQEFGLDSDDDDGVDETFYLSGVGTHDAFYTAGVEFSEGECRSTRIFGDGGQGEVDEFEEVLLYEPVTSSVVFASLIEESSVIGFNNQDYDFEMLVLEDGHGTDVETTTYYFFVELS